LSPKIGNTSTEKAASAFFETRQLRGEDTQTAPNEPSNGRSRPRVSFSFPGAFFRVGDVQQDDSQQQSVSIESVSSEDSEESEMFVIPRASLVEDDKMWKHKTAPAVYMIYQWWRLPTKELDPMKVLPLSQEEKERLDFSGFPWWLVCFS